MIRFHVYDFPPAQIEETDMTDQPTPQKTFEVVLVDGRRLTVQGDYLDTERDTSLVIADGRGRHVFAVRTPVIAYAFEQGTVTEQDKPSAYTPKLTVRQIDDLAIHVGSVGRSGGTPRDVVESVLADLGIDWERPA